MSDVVVDASAALGWILPSQATASAASFLENSSDRRLVAPSIFSWEIRNVLLSLDRRGLMASIDYLPALRGLEDLPVTTAPASTDAEVRELASVARRLGLSLFDAAYFVMAFEGPNALASRDGGLLRVAAANGIECFDFRAGAES